MMMLNAENGHDKASPPRGDRSTPLSGDPGMPLLMHLALPPLPPLVVLAGAAIGDWAVLLDAVKARLRLSVGERAAHEALPELLDTEGRVQVSVLECVEALDQLQLTLSYELDRRQRLEQEVFDAHAALAQARAELAGTQAGERHARHLALHDGLTLLPNRRYFRERLEHALAHLDLAEPGLAVLYLDLDGFKPINDCHGHDVGDELLRIVATRLNRVVRSEDMVSRLGGDEFACLRAGRIPREQLALLAGKLFEAVAAPLKIGQLVLSIHPSIGVATYPEDGITAAALLKSADAAMYCAKRLRSRYAFRDQLDLGLLTVD